MWLLLMDAVEFCPETGQFISPILARTHTINHLASLGHISIKSFLDSSLPLTFRQTSLDEFLSLSYSLSISLTLSFSVPLSLSHLLSLSLSSFPCSLACTLYSVSRSLSLGLSLLFFSSPICGLFPGILFWTEKRKRLLVALPEYSGGPPSPSPLDSSASSQPLSFHLTQTPAVLHEHLRHHHNTHNSVIFHISVPLTHTLTHTQTRACTHIHTCVTNHSHRGVDVLASH